MGLVQASPGTAATSVYNSSMASGLHFTWANDSINILLRVLEWLYWNDRLPAVARDHAKLACNLLIGPFQPPANLSPVLPVSLALRGEAPNVFPSQTPLYNHLAYEYDHYAATVAFQENLRPYRLAIDAPDPHEQPTAQPSINEDAPYNATSFAESDDLAGLPASYPSQETVWEEGSVSDTHYRENLDSKYNRLHDQSAGPYKRGTTKTSKSYSTDRYSWTRSFGTTSSAPTGGSLHRNIVSVNALSSVASQIPIARQHSIENNAIDSSIDKGKEVMYPTTTPPPEVRAADSMPHLLLPYGANPGVLFGNDQPSFPSLIADDVLEELNEEEMPASHHDNQADAQEEINYFEQAWVDENTEPSVTQFPTEVSLVHPSDPQPWTSDPGTFGFVTFQP
ncbi:hypothetical protein MMC25_002227 [Agyrium rufum]|nr:hypothetical protein [Agyrium rufum]